MSKRNKIEELLRKLRGGKCDDGDDHEFVEIINPDFIEPHVANAGLMAKLEEQKEALRERPDLAFVYRPGITAIEVFEQACSRLSHCQGPDEHDWVTLNLVSTLLKHIPPDQIDSVSRDLMRKFVV